MKALKSLRASRVALVCASALVAVLVLPGLAQGQAILSSASAEPGETRAAVIDLEDLIVVGESRATTGDGEAAPQGEYTLLRVGETRILYPALNPGGIFECADLGAEVCLAVLASATESDEDSSDAFGTAVGLGITTEEGDGLAILVADSSAGNEAGGTNCGAQSALLQIGTRFDELAERIVLDNSDAVGDCSVEEEDDEGDDDDGGDPAP